MSASVFTINPLFLEEKFALSFRESYRSKSSEVFQQNGCQLLRFPFSCGTFAEFLDLRDHSDSNITSRQQLVDEFEQQTRKLPFIRKRNDMFTFSQSVDIVNLELENGKLMEDVSLLTDFRHFLLSDVLPWLEKLTGIELDHGKVDLTSSIYGSGDVLLCHDDELEGRRIAFIWYLVPEDWDPATDGGFLQLFSCQTDDDDKSHHCPDLQNPPARLNPWKVVSSLGPKRNMFAFFEVSAYSFHQVTEILGQKERLSLHGWFHGPSLPRPAERDHPTQIPRISPVHIEEALIYRWLNPVYIDMSQQAKIRRRFLRASEIQLTNFLKIEEWKELARVLASIEHSQAWINVGPFNRKHYQTLRWNSAAETPDPVPDVLRQLNRLFASEAMQVILSDLTGIRLHPSSIMLDSKTPDCVNTIPPEPKRSRLEDTEASDNSQTASADCALLTEPQLRRWRPGNYTLLADTELAGGGWRLECVLHLDGYGRPSSKNAKKKNMPVQSVTSEGSSSAGECVPCWDASWGGQIVYIAKDEVDPLLTVQPVDNALTLVYIGPDTASFVKYINHKARPLSLQCSDGDETVDHKPDPGAEQNARHVASAYDLAITYFEPGADTQSEGTQVSENEDVSSGDDGSVGEEQEEEEEEEADEEEEEEAKQAE